MIRLTGLWKQKSETSDYLSGVFGGGRFVILPNTMKVKDSDPDFVLYMAERETKA